jgi:hypothetical protein
LAGEPLNHRGQGGLLGSGAVPLPDQGVRALGVEVLVLAIVAGSAV